MTNGHHHHHPTANEHNPGHSTNKENKKGAQEMSTMSLGPMRVGVAVYCNGGGGGGPFIVLVLLWLCTSSLLEKKKSLVD